MSDQIIKEMAAAIIEHEKSFVSETKALRMARYAFAVAEPLLRERHYQDFVFTHGIPDLTIGVTNFAPKKSG